MNKKFVFDSGTIRGILTSLVGALVVALQLDWSDTDVQVVVGALLVVGGSLYGIYRRWIADAPLTAKKDSSQSGYARRQPLVMLFAASLVGVCVVYAIMSISGCAVMQERSGPEKARIVVSELTKGYQEAIKEFAAYRNGLQNTERRQFANDKVVPAFRAAGAALDTARATAIVYTAAHDEWEAEKANEAYQAALLSARQALSFASDLYRALKEGDDQ